MRVGGERYRGGGPGVESRYAFSFGGHYEPDNVGFGALVACNEERLEAGAGFAEHGHRDTEIVTWVIEGELEHRDGSGRVARLRAGDVQLLSAAGGVRHEERNAGSGPLRFLQMWLRPDTFGGQPHYTAVTAPASPGAGLTLVASGFPDDCAPVRLRHHGVALYAARATPPGACPLPTAPTRYLHTLRGTLLLDDHPLTPGDSARITAEPHLQAEVTTPADFLLWTMTPTPAPPPNPHPPRAPKPHPARAPKPSPPGV